MTLRNCGCARKLCKNKDNDIIKIVAPDVLSTVCDEGIYISDLYPIPAQAAPWLAGSPEIDSLVFDLVFLPGSPGVRVDTNKVYSVSVFGGARILYTNSVCRCDSFQNHGTVANVLVSSWLWKGLGGGKWTPSSTMSVTIGIVEAPLINIPPQLTYPVVTYPVGITDPEPASVPLMCRRGICPPRFGRYAADAIICNTKAANGLFSLPHNKAGVFLWVYTHPANKVVMNAVANTLMVDPPPGKADLIVSGEIWSQLGQDANSEDSIAVVAYLSTNTSPDYGPNVWLDLNDLPDQGVIIPGVKPGSDNVHFYVRAGQ